MSLSLQSVAWVPHVWSCHSPPPCGSFRPLLDAPRGASNLLLRVWRPLLTSRIHHYKALSNRHNRTTRNCELGHCQHPHRHRGKPKQQVRKWLAQAHRANQLLGPKLVPSDLSSGLHTLLLEGMRTGDARLDPHSSRGNSLSSTHPWEPRGTLHQAGDPLLSWACPLLCSGAVALLSSPGHLIIALRAWVGLTKP